ncbi:hypothetical protein FB565_000174 [Actinoplanes lutulentus]|uniref:Uncharacterized protein n=1 Tax=Actinoplanes lutulentus TaxID=1287878 RepID=A0A327YXH2_9ACTN|nr:hypothetical protein [Actinoplanes lutulentus]MBB2940470.1 hypothetical protein [Actinoplanes lutulentus]RAK25798.1 hypothetical protein B0I29_1306 [Actinoplanes lutulentus]
MTFKTHGDEQQQLHKLVEELSRVPLWTQRTSAPPPVVSPPGSALAEDDKHTGPYRMSYAVRFALTIAVEHLAGLRSSITDCATCAPHQVNLFLNSSYSILRGALENASRALWLMAPDESTERVRRRLCMQTGNIKQSDKFAELSGRSHPAPKATRLARLQEIADQAGLTGQSLSMPQYHEIVRAAGEAIAEGQGAHFEKLWKFCSGAAHGDEWASYGLQERGEIVLRSDGISYQATASTAILTTVTTETAAVITCAFALYDARMNPSS